MANGDKLTLSPAPQPGFSFVVPTSGALTFANGLDANAKV